MRIGVELVLVFVTRYFLRQRRKQEAVGAQGKLSQVQPFIIGLLNPRPSCCLVAYPCVSNRCLTSVLVDVDKALIDPSTTASSKVDGTMIIWQANEARLIMRTQPIPGLRHVIRNCRRPSSNSLEVESIYSAGIPWS